MSKIRFAILAGVSTDAQSAEEKQSIPNQVETCRAVVAQHGAEATGPYIMDGYSRTGYDSLDVAMSEIPPLKQAIEDATANKYDILIMDNFDRLGDIGYMVKTRFKKLKKQLYSARQSARVIPPELYDPYSDDSTDISMHIEGIIQTYRINKIRRGWNIGIPDRARKGLHPLSIPYGYKLSSPNEPAQQIPEQIALIIQMKDLFLQGKTFQEICEHANASGIKQRRSDNWQRTIVKRIVLNTYYAGIIVYNRTSARKQLPQSQWITAPGKHQPIWDEKTHAAILVEMERRDGLRTRAKTYALTGLLQCAVCGKRIYRHGKINSPYPVHISCESLLHGHVSIRYEDALELVSAFIANAIHTQSGNDNVINLEAWQAELEAHKAARARVQLGYEQNLYTADETRQRLVAIENQMETVTAKINRATQSAQNLTTLAALAKTEPALIQNWIRTDDPTTVNRLLTTLIHHITITPDHKLEITWR